MCSVLMYTPKVGLEKKPFCAIRAYCTERFCAIRAYCTEKSRAACNNIGVVTAAVKLLCTVVQHYDYRFCAIRAYCTEPFVVLQ